jgi:hypothetical protein
VSNTSPASVRIEMPPPSRTSAACISQHSFQQGNVSKIVSVNTYQFARHCNASRFDVLILDLPSSKYPPLRKYEHAPYRPPSCTALHHFREHASPSSKTS